ncbi:hypothetical protein Ais01nite_16850 [Asanoa ishikariensis]|uniref:DUF3891 domain-containing protein n=1 Tax=Asanoa ishikariensis TaxID=137265 RepID=A0A1H3UF92_9ACTN|nr:DUF3891 family protein [Asanoa ishikariensis]GIF63650.1 hypothetical protein Ais01nite_16850 [Asanoa ishikariensis]SDZ61120.1 Protein of unknown function [Asanoa ishikariensis]
MIVTRRDGALHLVEQIEHGRIAGVLAAAWGNDSFEAPTPGEPVRTAATRHDEGWRAWDARVLFHELDRRPLHFLEIDASEHVQLYRQGVERVSLGDVYAGVLVGMHWTGLYRGRWSAPGARGRLDLGADGRAAQDAAVDAEERRWVPAKRLAWTAQEPRAAFETRLWHNFELLQLWDLLSLYLCVMPQQPAAAPGPATPWGPQLAALEHAAEDVLLPSVRGNPFGPAHRITIGVRAPGVLWLDPYPFAAALSVDVVSTAVPDRPSSHAELTSRVGRTPATVTTWRLAPWSD